jgi:hypothetical protein
MSYATAAASTSQALGFSVLFGVDDASDGGTAILDAVGYAASGSWSQQVSECTLQVLSYPAGLEVGMDVQITQAINGESHLAYRGKFVDIAPWQLDSDFGVTISLVLRGILGDVQESWGGPERVYNATLTDFERRDGQVIINLIEACGIDSSRHSIVNSVLLDEDDVPGLWLLGGVEDVVLKVGDSPLELVNQIDAVAGYVTVDQLDGFIERFENSPAGSGTGADATFTEGQTGVRISRSLKTTHGIINKWVVRGVTYETAEIEQEIEDDSAVLDALRPGTAPNRNGAEFSSPLIENDNHAFRVAEHRLSFTNRKQAGFDIELETARPDIRLLDSVTFTYPSIGVSSPATVLVSAISIEVQISRDGVSASTQLQTNGGTLALNTV